MHFDATYREDVTLDDGTRVRLRLVRPGDKQLLRDGFDHLSPESRYRRFLAAKSALSAAELAYLTEVDQIHHFAIGALARGEAGEQRGIGVARFVCVEPGVAEPAIAVTDDAQGKGLGRILFVRLVGAARERGVSRFRAELFASNQPMRELLEHVGSVVKRDVAGEGVLRIEVALEEMVPPLSAERRKNPLYQALVLAASGAVKLRRMIATFERSDDPQASPEEAAPGAEQGGADVEPPSDPGGAVSGSSPSSRASRP